MNDEAWIGVDLDGTLAEYHEWVSPTYIGMPIPKMVERVKKWVDEGQNVRIFTARVSPVAAKMNGISVEDCRNAIEKWMVDVFGFTLPITHEKDHAMIGLWDDLTLVQVAKNTGERHAKEHLVGKRNPNGQFVASDPIFDKIKFRLLNTNNGLVEYWTLGKLIGTTFRRGQFKFMGRSTGLLDKNGKEIYEGDRIKMNAEGVAGYNFGERIDFDIDYIGEAIILPSMGACIKNITWTDNKSGSTGRNSGYKNIRGYRSKIIGHIYDGKSEA